MVIFADRLSAYVDKVIDDYSSITPAEAQMLSQNIGLKANQRYAYTRSAAPVLLTKKGTDFLPLLETTWDQGKGYNTTAYHRADVFEWFPQTNTQISYSGHAWVIDDYHVSHESFISGGKLFQRAVCMVHCNLG
ncbi:MAG: hypothetical protein LBC27_01195 [Spirochaetaceae bacterium]|nr:hypothetical protein [Spirochaetaceae bacterium]